MQGIIEAAARLQALLEEGERPTAVTDDDGVSYAVTYGEDEYEDVFVVIEYQLPENLFAEIEEGTYGQLQGIRFYPGELIPEE